VSPSRIALLNAPDLIIADEPTTALDVTIQGQILFEMQKLCRETGAGPHLDHARPLGGLGARGRGLRHVRGPHRRVGYRWTTMLELPMHPYTRGLLESIPGRNARDGPSRRFPA
jgi:peptide/nickel transport system ATP-binding protein